MINKNFTIHQVVLLCSGAAWFMSILILCLLSIALVETIPIWFWVGGPALVFVTVYFIVRWLVNFFIYRKIKLIYKYIHDTKFDVESKKSFIPESDSLELVEADVKKWSESHLREIDTLRALENYRRQFLGNISHELKTPLFNIQGYLHTLLEGGIYDNQINLKYLNRAAKNVERLETIVSDLETISQFESDQMVLELEPFDIKQLAREVFEDHEQMAREKQISLIFKQGADAEFSVVADRDRIRQVLNNLIGNAIKYGKNNGFVKVGFYDMDDRILVEVADDGIGIEEKHLKHVFDRFYRVDISRSRELGGSGLGLSIVKHIIEAHKQGVTVRSAPNKGSTFGFTLAKNR